MWKLLSETGLPTRGGLTGNKEVERVSVNLNLPLFDVPLSCFIMRPSIAVPRSSVPQTS